MTETLVCPRCRRMNPLGAAACSDCGASLQASTPVEIEEPRPLVTVDALCPMCGVPMHAGDVRIDFPVLLWNWNMLWLKVVFRLRGRREEATVLKPEDKHPAARCSRCGGVWIGAAAA